MSCCNANTGDARRQTNEKTETFQPAVDIYETPAEWVISADVPGAHAEGLDIRFEEGVLQLRAEVSPRECGGAQALAREYPVGTFERTFRVGRGVDPAGISAALDAGVLTIRLPKSESSRARRIDIRAN